MNPTDMIVSAENIARLMRQLERERQARLDAEAISERSLRELYKQKEDARLIARIASLANEDPQVESVFRHTLDAICKHAECAHASAFLVSPDHKELRQIEFDPKSAIVQSPATEHTDRHIVFDVRLPKIVLAENRPVWIERLDNDFMYMRDDGPLLGSLFLSRSWRTQKSAPSLFFIRLPNARSTKNSSTFWFRSASSLAEHWNGATARLF
jgi:hypothetical protein